VPGDSLLPPLYFPPISPRKSPELPLYNVDSFAPHAIAGRPSYETITGCRRHVDAEVGLSERFDEAFTLIGSRNEQWTTTTAHK